MMMVFFTWWLIYYDVRKVKAQAQYYSPLYRLLYMEKRKLKRRKKINRRLNSLEDIVIIKNFNIYRS